eukprot:CAMPEP_0202005844 /NCGR_PEP_ID=MMETSP0905-20130828/10775_1 /ASSEMBLY_ACC=CAM_ASM_000554 /TAXON_ID=420261 /ORGANISM="Thalassiosira antarctica, Strain CCMP982" /LENGTH=79 /DNA_ID=CAMNT_0048563489 /DNA_START=177 /DNA_END=413 /DNA_ORIENTATION=-
MAWAVVLAMAMAIRLAYGKVVCMCEMEAASGRAFWNGSEGESPEARSSSFVFVVLDNRYCFLWEEALSWQPYPPPMLLR